MKAGVYACLLIALLVLTAPAEGGILSEYLKRRSLATSWLLQSKGPRDCKTSNVVFTAKEGYVCTAELKSSPGKPCSWTDVPAEQCNAVNFIVSWEIFVCEIRNKLS